MINLKFCQGYEVGDTDVGGVLLELTRYPKYITGTDRRSVDNPDFLRDKTGLTAFQL
jgi:hypothetical protein